MMSNKFKGTPGPWLATVRNNNDMMTQYYGVLIGSVSVDVPTENEKVDSKLIAAAPELLEALQWIINNSDPFCSALEMHHDVDGEALYEIAVKAINKAIGE